MKENIRVIDTIKELDEIDMDGGGIIPYSIHRGKIYFLLGRETLDIKWEESGMWAEFGGTREKNEKNIDCIIREFQEETNGFFGEKRIIKKRILRKKNNIIIYNLNYKNIIIFYKIAYDKKLISYYNDSYNFLTKSIQKISNKNMNEINKNGLFEKDRIDYFEFNKNILEMNLRDCIRQSLNYMLKNNKKIIKNL